MGTSDLKLARPKRGGSKSTASGRALGLALARRIDDTTSLLRQAKTHIKRADKPGRGKAKTQIRALQTLLVDVERDALSAGVTQEFAEDATRLLSQIDDHADRLIGRKKPKKRHLRRARKDLRRVRRKLEALLSNAGRALPSSPKLVIPPEPGQTDTPTSESSLRAAASGETEPTATP